MSSKFTGLVWDLDLPHEQRLVLLAMVDHADHWGNNIYPSPELTAWKTQYSERHVRRIVKQLLTDGLLVKKGYGPHGVIRYSIDLTKGILKPPFRPAENDSVPSPDKMSEGGQNVIPLDKTSYDKMPEGMTSSASRYDKMSDKPTTEPKEELQVRKDTYPPPPPEKAAKPKNAKQSHARPTLSITPLDTSQPWPSPHALALLWNERADPALERVLGITAWREQAIPPFLASFPEPATWEQAIATINASDWACGRLEQPTPGHENFRVEFDWLFKSGRDGRSNLVKILEGKYRRTPQNARGPAVNTPDAKTQRNIDAAKRVMEKYAHGPAATT